ncbi:integral membrane sensor signal transduction histidine kinase [Pseudodesulfovibrio mercurii]|uniref:histidine kinase n=1 Tax=Pseudodesulfovibrio mercurii TaxID=641491 RepID=F0JGA6_9BACT|nr:HAMP domain-containing sensor histidine kinase [Pseudodesulfovibrio mercurii]EGB13854.1 integral membrane sensor signal transduction histidine kinase [Pseudodesulfovibrio mercurii]
MMKVSRLYLKILFAFILVQAVAIAGIGGLLKMGHMRPPFTLHAKNRTEALKQIIGLETDGATRLTPELRARLDRVLDIYANAFSGDAWITDERGVTVAQSYRTPPLTGEEELELKLVTKQNDRIYFIRKGDKGSIYSYGPLKTPLGTLTVHLLNEWITHNEEVWFMEGLLLMATVAALLLIPVSRRLTRPMVQMTRSAQQLARGDFTPRVFDDRKDEMGTLARTFNHMVNSLEKMVRGGRELTANLSHELRSPLARIRVSQQIVLERLEAGRTDGVVKHVRRMEEEIDHMDSLIDQIMKLSKLDLQEPPPREDMADMNVMLEEAAERVGPLTGARSIRLQLYLSPVPAFRCRRQDLRIVLDNVLSNAVKYSPDNGRVDIRCGAEWEDDREAVVIRVSNAYPPLSDDELEAVFAPFRRLGYDEVEGNGLGLAFARKIVEDHGGTIRARSEDETFRVTIRLPLDRE